MIPPKRKQNYMSFSDNENCCVHTSDVHSLRKSTQRGQRSGIAILPKHYYVTTIELVPLIHADSNIIRILG